MALAHAPPTRTQERRSRPARRAVLGALAAIVLAMAAPSASADEREPGQDEPCTPGLVGLGCYWPWVNSYCYAWVACTPTDSDERLGELWQEHVLGSVPWNCVATVHNCT